MQMRYQELPINRRVLHNKDLNGQDSPTPFRYFCTVPAARPAADNNACSFTKPHLRGLHVADQTRSRDPLADYVALAGIWFIRGRTEVPYESWNSVCFPDTWFKRRRVALAPIPCRRIKEVMGPMTSSFIDRTSRPPTPQWSKRVLVRQPQVNDSIGREIQVRGGQSGIPS